MHLDSRGARLHATTAGLRAPAHPDEPIDPIIPTAKDYNHHVAAALVGTFLGILLCYGVMAPIATSVELQAQAETRYLMAIREGVLCATRGNAPELSVEFARRVIFSDERPTSKDMSKLLAAAKS